ncbi:MAG TPA: DUF1365 domain-containing protein [Conexibacter sp.]|nr:DUF1365 domain-containing protein [Conexibacter sp.]
MNAAAHTSAAADRLALPSRDEVQAGHFGAGRRASAIYEGVVTHRRRTPVAHAFRFSLFLMYIDLAELPQLFDGHPLWSARRRAVACFRRADYLGDAAVPLDTAVRELVQDRLGFRPAGPVRMLAHLRYLGHCFNPVVFYWCFAPDGARVEAVVAEVTNTPWGERHAYVVAGEGNADHVLESRHEKALHVSPFMAMEMTYRWRVGTPGKRLAVTIENRDADGALVFDAQLALSRREITRTSLTRVLARHPAMTLRVLGGIYGQALRLRLKRAPWHAKPVSTSPACATPASPASVSPTSARPTATVPPSGEAAA